MNEDIEGTDLDWNYMQEKMLHESKTIDFILGFAICLFFLFLFLFLFLGTCDLVGII